MGDGQTVDTTRFSDTLRQWNRRKCGVLFCLSIAIFLLGPVKDALSFPGLDAIGEPSGPQALTVAGNSDGDETPIRADRLLGSQRDEPVPSQTDGSGQPDQGAALAAAAPEIPYRAGAALQPGTADPGRVRSGPPATVRSRAPPAF